MSIEAMKQALEAIQDLRGYRPDIDKAIEALRTAIQQAEAAASGPVARVDYSERGNIAWLFGQQLPDGTELFKHPAPGVPGALKDHQIAALVNKVRDIARMFHDHQSLRERIAIELVPAIKASQEVKSNAERWHYAIAESGNQSMNFIDIFDDWDGDGSFVEAFDKARLADKKEGSAA